ncbi:MAG: hypothetical protein HOW73_24515 [Polyangiaceae bacterium]|nr:hypothetical protein [Polyangiaceae bacterium]
MNALYRFAPTALVMLSAACGDRDRVVKDGEKPPRHETHVVARGAGWQEVTADWPRSSKEAARFMSDKYGPPDEMTPTELKWFDRGPWKRSIVSREEVPHDWPSPHVDVLEQVINFRVPPEKAEDLTTFDGSVMFERTKGEMSARCGGEGANFLAINLARDIVEDTRSVHDARRLYEETMKSHEAGRSPELMKSLLFMPPKSGTADRDHGATVSSLDVD